MKKRRFSPIVALIGLAVLLCGSSWIDSGQTVSGSAQGKRDRAVELPKARNSSEDAKIDSRSFIVSIPAEGEFYVGSRLLTLGTLAAMIRDTVYDSPPDEQIVYARCAASLKFDDIRQLLNAMRQVGFDRVGFVVEAPESGRDAVIEAQIFMPNGVKVDPRDSIDVPARPREKVSHSTPPPPPPPPPPPGASRGRQIAIPIGPLDSDALVVEVKSGGAGGDQLIALNTRIMPLSELHEFLSNILEMRPGKEIFVKPSRDRSYGEVIAVMDEIKGAGADPLLLLIDEVEVPRTIPNPGRRPPALPSHALPGGGGVASGVVGGVPGGEPDEAPKIIRKSGGVFRDSATRRVEAKTPPLAKAAKVTGTVVVEVIVNERGDVISARAISGHPLLKEAAVQAARGWKFARTELSGEPVKVISTLTFTFKE